jgi:hypothetical protein
MWSDHWGIPVLVAGDYPLCHLLTATVQSSTEGAPASGPERVWYSVAVHDSCYEIPS